MTYSDRLGMTCAGVRCVEKDGIQHVYIPADLDIKVNFINNLADSMSIIHAHG